MTAKAKASGESETDRPRAVCVWCKQRFDGAVEPQLHVTKLGAPGMFHPACFAEYQQTPSA